MPQETELLECYEAIARTSDEMLRAAQSGDWRRFDDLENDCGRLIAQSRTQAARAKLGPEQQHVRMAALRRVLVADAQIRHLTEPDMQRVGAILKLAPPSSPAS